MLLSWVAFVDVGFAHHDARVTLFPWIISGDLKIDWALRIDTLTAVMLVVVGTISALVHLYSIGYMEEIHTARVSLPICPCSLSRC